MPYPMVHLSIAYEILLKTRAVQKQGDFLLGSVAPDSVHFREGYQREMKEVSHLWRTPQSGACGPEWGVTLDRDKWRANIQNFWEENRGKEHHDFLMGYCLHLLTDWECDLTLWRPVRREAEESGNLEIFSIYREESLVYDYYLYLTNPHRTRIFHLLGEGAGYDVPDFVLERDIAVMQKSLLTEQFCNRKAGNVAAGRYCRAGQMEHMIAHCADTFSVVLLT